MAEERLENFQSGGLTSDSNIIKEKRPAHRHLSMIHATLKDPMMLMMIRMTTIGKKPVYSTTSSTNSFPKKNVLFKVASLWSDAQNTLERVPLIEHSAGL